jgi:uncharacterized protein YuzE
MKITYDSEGDVLYIQLRDDVPMGDGVDLEEGVVADFDDDGHIIGLEVLDASERLTPDELSKLSYEDLVSEECAHLELPAVLRSKPRP